MGDRERLERELARLGSIGDGRGRIEIVHAEERIEMDDPPTVVRKKRRSSLVVCAELVREGKAQAMVSAGNTGAAMVAAKLFLGALPGVDRPALAAVFPNPRGRTVVLDVGANVDSRPEHLRQFAVMGHFYAQEVVGITRPADRPAVDRRGRGERAPASRARCSASLKATGLNFIGNVEGRDVFNGEADVVVCDGFVGNVLLKSAESMAELIVSMMREELRRTARTRLGGWLARPAFLAFKRRTDYAEYGAVPLLGVAGGCFIAHGRSNAKAIRSSIQRAVEFGGRRAARQDPRQGRGAARRRGAPGRRGRRSVRGPHRQRRELTADGRDCLQPKTAFLFPGQGSQKIGMGRAWAEAFPAARAVFDEASEALGFDVAKLCWEGPDSELQLTANTQPAILTASVAIERVLAAHGLVPDAVAGHSLGEYSALVAAGVLACSRCRPPGAAPRRADAGGGAGRRRRDGGDPRARRPTRSAALAADRRRPPPARSARSPTTTRPSRR